MRRLRCLVPLLLVAAVACKKKPESEPAPTKPIDAAAPRLPDRGSADVLPAQKITPLGADLSADPAAATGAPEIAADGDAPFVVWLEAGKVQLRRWSGSAWTETGAPPNDATHRAEGAPSIAAEADGGVLVAWLERNAKDVSTLQVARWHAGAWTALGELGTGRAVLDATIRISALGPLAVWRETGATADVAGLHVAVLGDKGWTPLGDGVLQGAPDSTVPVPAAVATRAGGPVVIGWIERTPVPTTQLRRWDATTSTWETLPVPPGVDVASTLALTMAPDGTVYFCLSDHNGMREPMALPKGATAWTPLNVPEFSNGPVVNQRFTAGDDGRVVLTYPYGGRYAYWDSRRWNPTSLNVIAPSTIVPAASVAKDGTVYVAWPVAADGKDKVHVVKVE